MQKSTARITGIATGGLLLLAAYFGWTLLFTGDRTIDLLPPITTYTSLDALVQDPKFKGKVIYGDIWGTSCGPCIQEFQTATQPLKQHYQGRGDIAFLYVCIDTHPGAEYRWKKRIKEDHIQGQHVLLSEEQFTKFYAQVAGQPNALTTLPRYFITDKKGHLLYRAARRPSETTALYSQLDSALAIN